MEQNLLKNSSSPFLLQGKQQLPQLKKLVGVKKINYKDRSLRQSKSFKNLSGINNQNNDIYNLNEQAFKTLTNISDRVYHYKPKPKFLLTESSNLKTTYDTLFSKHTITSISKQSPQNQEKLSKFIQLSPDCRDKTQYGKFFPSLNQWKKPKIQQKDQVLSKDLLNESITWISSPRLQESVVKLENLKLLKNYSSNQQIYNQDQRVKFVYNDYHSSATQNGYVRNSLGGKFFTR